MEEYLPGALGLLWSQDRSALEVVEFRKHVADVSDGYGFCRESIVV